MSISFFRFFSVMPWSVSSCLAPSLDISELILLASSFMHFCMSLRATARRCSQLLGFTKFTTLALTPTAHRLSLSLTSLNTASASEPYFSSSTLSVSLYAGSSTKLLSFVWSSRRANTLAIALAACTSMFFSSLPMALNSLPISFIPPLTSLMTSSALRSTTSAISLTLFSISFTFASMSLAALSSSAFMVLYTSPNVFCRSE